MEARPSMQQKRRSVSYTHLDVYKRQMKKYAIRLKYTLEEYEKVNGEPMRDENGRVITVPVAG